MAFYFPKVYKYKYNSKELQNEMGLNAYDYGARFYTPDAPHFWQIDPKAGKYTNISPYAYVANNPINAIDPDGKEIIFIVRDGYDIKDRLTYKNGNFWHQNGTRYNPGKESLSPSLYKVLSSYRKIEKSGDKSLIRKLKQLETSERVHWVEESRNSASVVNPYDAYLTRKDLDKLIAKGTKVATTTKYNFSEEEKKKFEEMEGVEDSDYTTVVHEIQHQYDFDQGNMADSMEIESSSEDPAEIRAVFFENLARKSARLDKRLRYGGDLIDKEKADNPPNNN